MKIKWKTREHKNSNDCWVHPLMHAENKTYDEIYEMFKPFLDEDGSLLHSFTEAYLIKNDFRIFDVRDYNLYGILKDFNTRETQVIVEVTNDHLIYLENDTVYDIVDITQREKWLDYDVTKIYLKSKE